MSDADVGVLDRALYALFSRRADARRHEADRKRYRGTTVAASFDVFLARVYGASWLAFLAAATAGFAVAATAGSRPLAAATRTVGLALPPVALAGCAALVAGGLAKRGTVALGGLYLRWRARARRADIERTLPGVARYLRALATGSRSERAMLRKVADQDAYGETATACRKVVARADLTGSLDDALRTVARDTPAQDTLSPFLLKFREHAEQGADAVERYLGLEARMLGRRQQRQRREAEGFLELLAELFVVLLVLPTLLVIILTVLGVLSPGLAREVGTPFGAVTVRALLVYGSIAFVLGVGALAASLVNGLRPPNVTEAAHERARRPAGVVRGAVSNPANAAVAALPLPLLAAAVCLQAGLRPPNVALLAYAAYGLPVGVVAVRRARRDDAKDRQIKDFVHAVSGHVNLGRPLPEAVALVARDVDLGALNADVADLAFDLQTTARGDDVRAAALAEFVDSVGTPLAEQTVGLLTGALDVGSDTATVLDTLQAEIGRLYHEKKAFRANLLVYAAVGWTTAVLVVGVMVAVNLYVLESFEQLSAVSRSMDGFVLNPEAVDPDRDRFRFYLVTQATMLACGWFAGFAARGRYEALLHSAALVVVCFAVFTGVGAV